ncbi:LuxR C-terminal-related transcriptional regulator [Kitasatospora sp. NPDC058965]|uniref:LuxR C-terminal-related transcriptional regulator n=1 Tax=Kitasatospora sp. NPDC058965 TaxID=3346682 RepID=UPI0036BC35B9
MREGNTDLCLRCAAVDRTAVDRTAVEGLSGRRPTEGEQELLTLLAQGLTDEAVAKRLEVSVRTERRMVAAVMRRLEAVGRFQAGAEAARRLWI